MRSERQQQLYDFIKDNHTRYTLSQVAEIFHVPYDSAHKICAELGVKCLTANDVLRKIVQENKDKTADEISETFFYSIPSIKKVAESLGIALPKKERKQRYSVKREISKIQLKNQMKSKTKVQGTVYTQTASPYGIATELHGIKTINR